MNIFSILVTSVFAAETILSPLGGMPTPEIEIKKPQVSFGSLSATPAVLSDEPFIGPIMAAVSPTPTPQPKPIRKTKQQTVTVALLGDSMMDTLGSDAPHLKNALKKIYPGTTFIIKNFGVGGANIQYGIERITNGYTYLGTSYTPLITTNPDIVVIESFGYNPFGDDQSAITTHWLLLAETIDTIKAHLPNTQIVMAATIAPNAHKFGDGAPGLAFSLEDKWKRVETIKKYLENAIRFANSEHLPLADAYHASLLSDGNGNLAYINSGDYIHYSDKGRQLMADRITGTIAQKRLLE
ncbi:MAG: SGNH/GDSL hydrolase family protein [Candidatus Gottesmanbacteria bacterium]